MTQMNLNKPETFLEAFEVMANYIQRNLGRKGKDRLGSESELCS